MEYEVMQFHIYFPTKALENWTPSFKPHPPKYFGRVIDFHVAKTIHVESMHPPHKN